MASLIQELVQNLKEQNQVYEILIDIAAKKKVAIIDNDIVKIQEIVAQENTIVGKSLRLTKKKDEIFNDISMVTNKKDLTISSIIESVKGQPEEKELTEVKEKATSILPKLKALNDQNQELVKLSLDYLNFSINILREGIFNTPTYFDSSGNEIDLSNKKMFDAKQ